MASMRISGCPVQALVPELVALRVSRKMEGSKISKTLALYLVLMKAKLDGIRSQWDKFKRFTNTHEFIHTQHPQSRQPICPLAPLSRSFYKLIEIVAYYDLLPTDDSPLVAFSFAEGPGGFLQALLHLRKNSADKYHGMTLARPSKTSVPGWRKAKDFLNKHPNVKVHLGLTGDGDMMSAPSLLHSFRKHGGTCDIVTGDGGFDFTADFANQEAKSLPLAFAQVAFALAVQAVGGTFVLKLFDTTSTASIDLLFMLCCAYDRVDIYKPNTSRSANSERYIVCRGFKQRATEALVLVLARALDKLASGWHPVRFLEAEIPYCFITALQEANAVFGQMQIECIANTLSLIRKPGADKIDSLVRSNTHRCVKWCQKHDLPYVYPGRRKGQCGP